MPTLVEAFIHSFNNITHDIDVREMTAITADRELGVLLQTLIQMLQPLAYQKSELTLNPKLKTAMRDKRLELALACRTLVLGRLEAG
jgi:hypothetical protein